MEAGYSSDPTSNQSSRTNIDIDGSWSAQHPGGHIADQYSPRRGASFLKASTLSLPQAPDSSVRANKLFNLQSTPSKPAHSQPRSAGLQRLKSAPTVVPSEQSEEALSSVDFDSNTEGVASEPRRPHYIASNGSQTEYAAGDRSQLEYASETARDQMSARPGAVREYWDTLLAEQAEADRRSHVVGAQQIPHAPSTGSSTLVDLDHVNAKSKDRLAHLRHTGILDRPESAPPHVHTPHTAHRSTNHNIGPRAPHTRESSHAAQQQTDRSASLTPQASLAHGHMNSRSVESDVVDRVHDIFARHIRQASQNSASSSVINRSTGVQASASISRSRRTDAPKQRLRDLLAASESRQAEISALSLPPRASPMHVAQRQRREARQNEARSPPQPKQALSPLLKADLMREWRQIADDEAQQRTNSDEHSELDDRERSPTIQPVDWPGRQPPRQEAEATESSSSDIISPARILRVKRRSRRTSSPSVEGSRRSSPVAIVSLRSSASRPALQASTSRTPAKPRTPPKTPHPPGHCISETPFQSSPRKGTAHAQTTFNDSLLSTAQSKRIAFPGSYRSPAPQKSAQPHKTAQPQQGPERSVRFRSPKATPEARAVEDSTPKAENEDHLQDVEVVQAADETQQDAAPPAVNFSGDVSQSSLQLLLSDLMRPIRSILSSPRALKSEDGVSSDAMPTSQRALTRETQVTPPSSPRELFDTPVRQRLRVSNQFCSKDSADVCVQTEQTSLVAQLSAAEELDHRLSQRLQEAQLAVEEMGNELSARVGNVMSHSFKQEHRKRKRWLWLLLLSELLVIWLVLALANARADAYYHTIYQDPFYPLLRDDRGFRQLFATGFDGLRPAAPQLVLPDLYSSDSTVAPWHTFAHHFRQYLSTFLASVFSSTDFTHGSLVQDQSQYVNTVTSIHTAIPAVHRIPT